MSRLTSGPAALDLLDADKAEEFDLLISDYAMPGFSGVELATAVRKRWPNLPVLLVTGYSDVAPRRAQTEAGTGCTNRFGKPILRSMSVAGWP